MSIYTRYAKDVSESLFASVYSDLYDLAELQQKAIFRACKKYKDGSPKNYYIGDHKITLDGWCKGSVSLGDALDYIKIHGKGVSCLGYK